MSELKLPALDEEAMLAVAARLGAISGGQGVIYLHGDLGAGKTTFSRGLLRGRRHAGAVKSPTFTLVEPYDLGNGMVYHFDLYRLVDPEELEFMGIRELLRGALPVCLIEWPERGAAFAKEADLDTITIARIRTDAC